MFHTGGHDVFDRNSGFDMRVAYDGSGRQLYVGIAKAGTADADGKWQIYKIGYDVNSRMTRRRYADGTDDFIKSWTLRTGYTYLGI